MAYQLTVPYKQTQEELFPEPEEQEPDFWYYLLRFLPNLLKDIRDFGLGTAALGAEAITFPYKAATGQVEWEEIPGQIGEMGAAAWEDIAGRWGPLLRGDIGETGKQIAEHPGFAMLDVLSGLGLGGMGLKAAGVAGTAGKAALVEKALRALAGKFETSGAGLAAEEVGRTMMQAARTGSQGLVEELLAAARGAPATEAARLVEMAAAGAPAGLPAMSAVPEALQSLLRPAISAAERTIPGTAKEIGEIVAKAGPQWWAEAATTVGQAPGVAEKLKLLKAGEAIDPASWSKVLGDIWARSGIKLPILGTAKSFQATQDIRKELGTLRSRHFFNLKDRLSEVDAALKGLTPEEYQAFIRRTQYLEPFDAGPWKIAPARAAELEATVQKIAPIMEEIVNDAGMPLTGEMPEFAKWRPYAQVKGLVKEGEEFTPEMLTSAKLVAEAEGLPAPVYMPHRVAQDLKKVEFRPATTGRFPKTPQLMEREGWLSTLLEEQTKPGSLEFPGRPTVVTDVPDLYRRYVANVERRNSAVELAEWITKHPAAKRLTKEEAKAKYWSGLAMPPGKVLFSPQSLIKFYEGQVRVGKQLTEFLEHAAEQGLDISKVLSDKADDIARWVEGALSEIKEAPYVYEIPEQFANEMREVAAARGVGRQIFDRVTGWWRSSVLSLPPALVRWMINEFSGNIGLIALKGLDVGGLPKTLTAAYSGVVPREITHGGLMRSLMHEPFMSAAEENPLARGILAAERTPPGKALGWTSEKGVQLNQAVEDFFRRVGYADETYREAKRQVFMELGSDALALDDAITNRMAEFAKNPEMVATLLDRTDRYLYNYSTKLSPKERQFARTLFPFYGFWKHMMQMVARVPLDHPMRAAMVQKAAVVGQKIQEEQIAEAAGVDEMPMEEQPPWVQGAVPTGATTPGGEPILFSATAMNPYGQLASMGGTEVGGIQLPGIHPMFTALGEAVSGVDWFTKKPIREEDTVTIGGHSWHFEEKTGKIEPARINVLNRLVERLPRQFPQFKLLGELASPIVKYARGIETGEETVEDVEERKRILAGLRSAGVKLYDVDLTDWFDRLQKSKKAAAKYFLKKQIEKEMGAMMQ